MDCNIVLSEPPAAAAGKTDYYRDGFRVMMKVVKFQALIIFVIALVAVAYFCTRKNTDRYFAQTGDGKIMQMPALPLPNMGRAAMSEWVADAASQIMTFGFNDVDARFALSQKGFTREGWETFRKAVMASGLIDDMMKAQQIVTSVPESPPILKQEGLINGHYTWVYEVPLLVTFRAGGAKVSRPKKVHVTIQRIPTRENPNGVGISEWNIY